MAELIPDERYVDLLLKIFILNSEERSRPVATSTANGPLFERDSTNLRPLFCNKCTTFQLSATMFSFPSTKVDAHLPKNQFHFLLDSSNSKWSKFFFAGVCLVAIMALALPAFQKFPQSKLHLSLCWTNSMKYFLCQDSHFQEFWMVWFTFD